MKREQRHTVHYLAARAKNGDEWSLSLLQRLSELAIAGSGALSGMSLPRSEAPNVAATPTADLLGAGASPIAARASHQRAAAGSDAVPATASEPPSQDERRVT